MRSTMKGPSRKPSRLHAHGCQIRALHSQATVNEERESVSTAGSSQESSDVSRRGLPNL